MISYLAAALELLELVLAELSHQSPAVHGIRAVGQLCI